MGDLKAVAILLSLFALTVYAGILAVVLVSIWLLPAVLISGGGATGLLAWRWNGRNHHA